MIPNVSVWVKGGRTRRLRRCYVRATGRPTRSREDQRWDPTGRGKIWFEVKCRRRLEKNRSGDLLVNRKESNFWTDISDIKTWVLTLYTYVSKYDNCLHFL